MPRARLILGFALLAASAALAALQCMNLAVAAWLGCCLALAPQSETEPERSETDPERSPE